MLCLLTVPHTDTATADSKGMAMGRDAVTLYMHTPCSGRRRSCFGVDCDGGDAVTAIIYIPPA